MEEGNRGEQRLTTSPPVHISQTEALIWAITRKKQFTLKANLIIKSWAQVCTLEIWLNLVYVHMHVAWSRWIKDTRMSKCLKLQKINFSQEKAFYRASLIYSWSFNNLITITKSKKSNQCEWFSYATVSHEVSVYYNVDFKLFQLVV